MSAPEPPAAAGSGAELAPAASKAANLAANNDPDTGPASTGPASTGPASTSPADTGPADTGPASTAKPSAPIATAPTTKPRRQPLPYQSLGVIVVGMSLAVWWPAFTLGAWGEIFFDTLLRVWVAATAAFFVVMLVPAARKRIGWTALTLLLPTLWLVLTIVVPDDTSNFWAAIVGLAGLLLVIVGIPAMIWVLARVIWPDISDQVPRRGKVLVFLTVLVIAVASYVLGANQARFLTCEDFSISGNSEPPGCVHETPAPLIAP